MASMNKELLNKILPYCGHGLSIPLLPSHCLQLNPDDYVSVESLEKNPYVI